MALNVGELVATIRADDSGWRSGLASAQLRLRGLATDAEGRLRDLRGRFVSEGQAAGRGLADGIRANAERAASALRAVGPAAAGIGVGVPAAAALAAALGGVAAGAAAASLAVGAFKLAVGPQLEQVTEVTELYEAAQKSAASGATDAAQKQKAYADALAKLPPATRATATAFMGLKSDYKAWSNSLSGTTMPVLTKGLNVLRTLLPMLTPFVKAAATALGDMLDRVAVGVKSARFKEWAADMAAASGTALRNFIQIIGNLAKGFGALLQTFLPTSAGVTGGLVSMTGAFAAWAAGLEGSDGFARFLEMAGTGGEMLGTLAEAVVGLLVALGPLMGATATLAVLLAELINSTPTPVLSALAGAFLAVRVAMMAYAGWTAIVRARNAVMALSATPVILGWLRMAATAVAAGARAALAWLRSSAAMVGAWLRMNAVGIAAMARIAAASTASALRTAAAWAGSALASIGAWVLAVLRASATAVAQFAIMAARAIVWAATMAAQWLIAMGPIGWIILAVAGLVTLIVAYWDEIKAFTVAAWDWIWAKIKSVADAIWNFFLNWTLYGLIIKHWATIRDTTISWWNGILNWLKAIPGRIYQAFLNWTLYGLIIRHWSAIKQATITKASEMLAWVRGLPARISASLSGMGTLLYNHGRNVVIGLWNGIKAMGGWLRSTLIGWAKSIVPGPIAKALGIASPSKVTAAQGRWIARGLVVGMTGSSKQVRAAATRLADIVRDSMRPGRGRTKALATISKGFSQLLGLAVREERLAVRMKAATKSLASQIATRDKLAADVRKGVLDGANITQGGGAEQVTADSLLRNLRAKMLAAKRFAQQLAQLRKRGVRSDLIAQIAQAGVEQGSSALAALSAANSNQIAAINSTQAQLVTAAGQAGAVAGDAMYGAGIQAARGLVAGLQKEQSAIERQMLAIAKGMSTAIRRALGIKSPSKVMADQVGRFIPAGLVQGIQSGVGAVDAAMAGLVTPPRVPAGVGVGAGLGGRASAGMAAGQPQRIILELRGPESMKALFREIVARDGGDVQKVLGNR